MASSFYQQRIGTGAGWRHIIIPQVYKKEKQEEKSIPKCFLILLQKEINENIKQAAKNMVCIGEYYFSL